MEILCSQSFILQTSLNRYFKKSQYYFTIWHPYSAENKLKEKELILVGRQSLTFPRISFIARFYSLLQDFQWAIPSNFSPVSKMVWIVSTTPGFGRVYVPFLSEKSTIHAMNCIVCISYPMPRLLFLCSMIGCLVRYIEVDIVPWKTVVKNKIDLVNSMYVPYYFYWTCCVLYIYYI